MDISSAFTAGLPGTYLAVVVVVAVMSQWLAWVLRVPSILLLLIAGFALGRGINATDVIERDLMYAGVSITVGIILFEGSLTLKFSELSGVDRSVRRLCTLAVVIAFPLIATCAWLAGVDARLAVLVGALLVVTGPTVINPILRQLKPTKRVSTLLRWEGIVVDPIGAVMATLVFQAIIAAGQPFTHVVSGLVLTLVVGFGLGLGVGVTLAWFQRRHAIPDFLQGVVFLGAAVGAFVTSNVIQHESGLLTVTVLGLFLANQPDLNLTRVREFKEHLQVLFVGSLFVLLAGQVTPEQLQRILPMAVIFIPLLILVARPVTMYLALLRSDSSPAERTLLAFMAPRGIVAAAVMSIFALELEHYASEAARETQLKTGSAAAEAMAHAAELDQLAKNAADLVPLVFLVVVVTVAVYGLGVSRLAERLGLASSKPQGVLFVGAPKWAIQAAERLKEVDVSVHIVGMNYAGVQQARRAGLSVDYTHILSDYALHEMDVAGLAFAIAASSDDEANSTAAREFGHVFGSANVFQLRRAKVLATAARKRQAGRHFSGQAPFTPAVTMSEFEQKIAEGMSVRRTKLSETFTRSDFLGRYPDAVIMFAVLDGKVTVITEVSDMPQTSGDIIALMPPRESRASKDRAAVAADGTPVSGKTAKVSTGAIPVIKKKAAEASAAGEKATQASADGGQDSSATDSETATGDGGSMGAEPSAEPETTPSESPAKTEPVVKRGSGPWTEAEPAAPRTDAERLRQAARAQEERVEQARLEEERAEAERQANAQAQRERAAAEKLAKKEKPAKRSSQRGLRRKARRDAAAQADEQQSQVPAQGAPGAKDSDGKAVDDSAGQKLPQQGKPAKKPKTRRPVSETPGVRQGWRGPGGGVRRSTSTKTAAKASPAKVEQTDSEPADSASTGSASKAPSAQQVASPEALPTQSGESRQSGKSDQGSASKRDAKSQQSSTTDPRGKRGRGGKSRHKAADKNSKPDA